MAQQYAIPGQTASAPVDPRVKKAFLRTLSRGEAPEGGYNYLLGGKRFTDMSRHPGTLNRSGKYASTAAGQYQFLKSTWDDETRKYGYKDFSEKTQDDAAWNYAKDTYAQNTGRDLQTDLSSNDPAILAGVAQALKGRWPSLPGGSQDNWKGANFADVYAKNLARVNTDGVPNADAAPDPTPNVGAGDSAYKLPVPADPTSNAGSGAGDYAPVATSDTGTGKDVEKAKKKDYGDIAGDAFEGLGKMFAASASQNARAPAGSTTVPAAAAPVPPGVQPMVDPRRAEMQRQQLALAMQRLNSGKLV
jgi:muramidase (phage lysozyme)